MLARDIMSQPAVSVSDTAPVGRAADILTRRGFTALPVIDELGHLTGIVGEADLIGNRFGMPQSPLGGGAGAATDRPAATVGEIMTQPVVAVAPDVSLEVLADTFRNRRLRCLPVVDGTRLVGVITRRDLVRASQS